MISNLSIYVKHVTLCAGYFWPQWHNLNKLGRGPLDDAMLYVPNIKGFRKEDYLNVFSNISLCKTCDTGARPFWPKGII